MATRRWVAAGGLAAAGLGATLVVGPRDPLALAWLALVAAPCGVLAAPLGRAAALPPLAWAIALGSIGAGAGPAAALGGLFGLGLALGTWRPTRLWGDAGATLLAAACLTGLPALGGLAGSAPWSRRVTARALDLSPVVLVVESAGVDWTRHPAVYGAARGDDLGPDLRTPWGGALAGPALLLVGCALLLVARRSAAHPA